MSNTIDRKVVEMRFENGQFESGVAESMSTIDKLKKNLKFDGATKGLEKVNSASRNIDFKKIENAACEAPWCYVQHGRQGCRPGKGHLSGNL